MVVADGMLLETQQAFDAVAGDYHRSNVENPLLAAMRARTLARVLAHTAPGTRVLNLGCGPGTDDEVLGRAGCTVTAIDSSEAMVTQARARITRAGLMHRVRVHHLDIQDLGRLSPRVFDVACSNFGPLNCVADLTEAARRIAERLVPGGLLIASVIGRVCPWELAVHLARGKWARARLRFARGVVAVPLCGRVVWMRYYAPSELEKAFAAAGFRREWLRALGLFVPPPYMDAFAARHPGFVSALQAVEDAAGEWPLVRQFGDHFLIALRKS